MSLSGNSGDFTFKEKCPSEGQLRRAFSRYSKVAWRTLKSAVSGEKADPQAGSPRKVTRAQPWARNLSSLSVFF